MQNIFIYNESVKCAQKIKSCNYKKKIKTKGNYSRCETEVSDFSTCSVRIKHVEVLAESERKDIKKNAPPEGFRDCEGWLVGGRATTHQSEWRRSH